ncbi:MAG: TSUP family transporter [Phycisphaera sp.]|nr:TSUP family transporter [Phycisphaera sp.]
MTFTQGILVLVIGLLGGVLGGMLGVGGSVIMIPGLTMALGPNQHLYQAAAMIANVAVSIPAALRHRRSGMMLPHVLKWMLPAAVVFILVGVWASNLELFRSSSGEQRLRRVFALFLVYVIYVNVVRLVRPRSSSDSDLTLDPVEVRENTRKTATPVRCGVVGSVMGTIGGLLGIGGGAVAVPMQQVLLRLPLRSCIANSSMVICVSAAIGAIYKNMTLGQHVVPSEPASVLSWSDSVMIAAVLAPTAWVGGRLGASLTHRLPLRVVRIAFVVLMIVAAWKMAGL